MATWITISADDLKVGKAAALVDALQSSALGDGQPDPTDDAVANATARIRSEIQSGGKIRVSATANTIPPSLKSLAVRLIIWDMQSRVNVLDSLKPSDQDVQDHRSDERYLERIARGEVTVDSADDAEAIADVQSTVGAPRVTVPAREFDRCHQDGI